MGECGKRERQIARREQQWPTAAVTTLTITYFAFTRTACIKAAATAAAAAAAATATATATTAATAATSSGHKHQHSSGSGREYRRWGRRWQQRWRQDMEQRDIQPRGWWSRTQLLGPSVAIFSSGIPQASWWRCAHRRDPEVGNRLSVWAWAQPETTDGRHLEPGHPATAAAAGGPGWQWWPWRGWWAGLRPTRRPASEQWQWRERTSGLCASATGAPLLGRATRWGVALIPSTAIL